MRPVAARIRTLFEQFVDLTEKEQSRLFRDGGFGPKEEARMFPARKLRKLSEALCRDVGKTGSPLVLLADGGLDNPNRLHNQIRFRNARQGQQPEKKRSA